MPAYLISLDPEGEWYDNRDAMEEYGRNVPQMVERYGGKYLLARRDPEVLEGDWNPGPIVLVEFPSRETLFAFYKSEEYRPWLEMRQRHGKTRIVISES